ncbi:MAG: hypothetical protein ACKN9D_07535, partial [Actinomycetales bacterium]
EERAATVAATYGGGAPALEADVVIEAEETASPAAPAAAQEAPANVHSSAELLEALTGTASDAPLCMTCGVKMRPAGSCYVCEGCGSTSGCS